MKSDLKIVFGDVISLNKDERLRLARKTLLNVFTYLNEMGLSPMRRMEVIEDTVYLSALIDGDINEEETLFIAAALNFNASLEEAKEVGNRIKIKEAEDLLLNTITQFEIDPGMDMCRLILIGELSDSDDINQVEEEFLEKMLFKLL